MEQAHKTSLTADTALQLTGAEENDRLEAAVLGRVDAQSFELFHLVLEDADVVHEGDDSVGGHGTGVEAGGGEQRGDVEGHRALGGVQHEQLTPRQPQQRHLTSSYRTIHQHHHHYHRRGFVRPPHLIVVSVVHRSSVCLSVCLSVFSRVTLLKWLYGYVVAFLSFLFLFLFFFFFFFLRITMLLRACRRVRGGAVRATQLLSTFGSC